MLIPNDPNDSINEMTMSPLTDPACVCTVPSISKWAKPLDRSIWYNDESDTHIFEKLKLYPFVKNSGWIALYPLTSQTVGVAAYHPWSC